jgi:hypothetical protein
LKSIGSVEVIVRALPQRFYKKRRRRRKARAAANISDHVI